MKILAQRPTHISAVATVLLITKTFTVKYYDRRQHQYKYSINNNKRERERRTVLPVSFLSQVGWGFDVSLGGELGKPSCGSTSTARTGVTGLHREQRGLNPASPTGQTALTPTHHRTLTQRSGVKDIKSGMHVGCDTCV